MLVPSVLASKSRWVCWKKEARDGKTTKIPYRADGKGRAKTNDPKTWSTLATARESLSSSDFDGIGFVLGDGVVGIDVDIPIDDPLTQGVIERFSGTYCERSPNGKLHVFALGSAVRSGKGATDKRFELYDERSPRFLTFTGDRIDGTADEVTAQPEAIEWLEATYFAKPDPAAKIIDRIRADSKWRALFDGEWEGNYSSQSEADLALCVDIASITRDPKLIDAVFRRSSLMRDKWDIVRGDATYGQKTVAQALERTAPIDPVPTDGKVLYGGMRKRVTDMADINKRYALLAAPGSPEAIIKRDEGRALTIDALNLVMGGEIVQIGVDASGNPKYMPAAKFWAGSYDKHTYRAIDFTGDAVNDKTLNLFQGFGVKPSAGGCDLILAHIQHVICNDDPIAFEAMLNLIAWQAQHIGRPSRVAVCLCSEEHQTGKGTLLEAVLLPIYGAAGLKIEKLEDITGDFNGALRGRSFIFADEATYLGDRKGAAVLKSLIASRQVSLNEKFLPRLSVPTGINIWMATNSASPIHIEEKDARYWVLVVNPNKRNDNPYFDALYAEIENGGRAAFLNMMLERDVSGFKPQSDIPLNNNAKLAAIRESRNPGATLNWLEHCFFAEAIVGLRFGRGTNHPWTVGDKVTPGDLSEAYYSWCKTLTGSGIRADGIAQFWAQLTVAGFSEKKTNGRRYRIVPSIDTVGRFLKMP